MFNEPGGMFNSFVREMRKKHDEAVEDAIIEALVTGHNLFVTPPRFDNIDMDAKIGDFITKVTVSFGCQPVPFGHEGPEVLVLERQHKVLIDKLIEAGWTPPGGLLDGS